MLSIGSFFEKFRNHELREFQKRGVAVRAIKECTGIELVEEKVSFKNGHLVIQASPVQKNEIFMKKEAVLSAIRRDLPTLSITTIS